LGSRVLRDLAVWSPRRLENHGAVWRSPHKKSKTKEKILFWLCGIWAMGIGVRMLAELLIHGDFLIFANALNIFLDFTPLTIFGCLSIVIILKDRIVRYHRRRNSLLHFAGYELEVRSHS
jgi:hypothetical protein